MRRWIWLILLLPFCGVQAKSQNLCPLVETIYYQDKTSSHYSAQSANGTVWQSEMLAAMNPISKGSFKGAMALGDSRSAQVMCFYQLGNNYITLKGNAQFSLEGKKWIPLAVQGGKVEYLCRGEVKDCTFNFLKFLN